jgi:Flp pilus assembly protein TadB
MLARISLPRSSWREMAEDRDPRQQRRRIEPEIIPPDRDRPTRRHGAFPDLEGTQRIYVARLGPFGGILLVLLVVILAALLLFTILGALLISIPVVAFIVLVVALSTLLRPRRR